MPYNWTFDSPATVQSGQDTIASPYAPQQMSNYDWAKKAGFTGDPWTGQTFGEAGGAPGGQSPEFEQWLKQNGYKWGYGVDPSGYQMGYFGADGQPVSQLEGNPNAWAKDNQMGGVMMAALGGFGGAMATGLLGGAAMAPTVVPTAGGMTSEMGAAMAAAGSPGATAATGGLTSEMGAAMAAAGSPGALAPAAGGGLAGAGTAATSVTPFTSILSNLGGAQNIMQMLAGLWGFKQSKDQAKLPSMEEFLGSPMYKAGEQAVTRSMLAQGYQGSGNMMQALATNAQDAYAKYAQLLRGQGQGALSDQMSALGLLTAGIGRLPGWGGGSAAPAPATPAIYGG